MSNDDRRKILEMLAAGKITADEAERLLAAMEKGPADAGEEETAGNPRRKPKYVRILVEDEGHKGPVKVNVRVPIQLLRAGVKLASLIPPEARDRVNSHLRREGIPFDLNQVTADNLEQLVDHLDDLTLDIDEHKTKVHLFCE
jgi:hypothetical protein